MKITDDKYYTPIYVANQCWEKVKKIIGLENIMVRSFIICTGNLILVLILNQNV